MTIMQQKTSYSQFKKKVYSLCSKIPSGKVTTYKLIALALNTKAYRAVGAALRCNPFAPTVPCHRVVASDGSLGGYQGKMNSPKKIALLKKEGISVKNGKIENFDEKLFSFVR